MEHLCPQCGIQVEDGTPFCPRCRAPQIRVVLAGVPDPALSASPEVILPPSARILPATAIDWRHAVPAMVLALLLAAVVTVVTFGSLGLGMLVAGALSVVLYHRRRPESHMTTGMGARLGATSGILGFGVMLAALAVAVGIFHEGDRVHQKVMEVFEQVAERNPQTQPVLDMMKTPDGFIAIAVMGGVFLLFACLLCSVVGGAVSGYLLSRKNRA